MSPLLVHVERVTRPRQLRSREPIRDDQDADRWCREGQLGVSARVGLVLLDGDLDRDSVVTSADFQTPGPIRAVDDPFPPELRKALDIPWEALVPRD